jgi:S-DNA-T family DNA segregation ATPase FtsK/SpoIIIE
VSLRVLQRADSEAVVGTRSASEIPPDLPGRGVVDPGDGCPVLFHSAVATPAAIDEVRSAVSGMPVARRTWLDPLPDRIAPDAVAALIGRSRSADPSGHGISGSGVDRAGEGVGFGVVDEPERQRRSLALWAPRRDGGLLVLGAPGTGRSTALAAVERGWAAPAPVEQAPVERGSVERAPVERASSGWTPAEQHAGSAVAAGILRLSGSSSAVWDGLVAAQSAIRGVGSPPALVVVDDLDTMFRAWPDEYRHAAFAMVESLIREGRGSGVAVAASVAQLHSLGPGLREAFGSRLLLRHATRSDLVQSGGRGELWRANDGAGAGQWHGRRVQVVDAEAVALRESSVIPRLELRSDAAYAVVAVAPRAAAAAIAATGRATIQLVAGGESAARAALAAHPAGAPAPVIVGDGEAWSASWSLLASLREEAVLIAHGGAGEYRALVRSRKLPPLLDDGAGQCWVIEPDQRPRRALWLNPVRH